MIQIVCRRCGATKQIECSTIHSRLVYMYTYFRCDNCKRKYNWKHLEIVVKLAE